MYTNHRFHLLIFWQRTCKWLLPLVWLLGLFLGICCAADAGDSFSLMMRGTDEFTVSIPGLLLVTVLPFLLTAFFVLLSQPWMLLVVVFLKAFSYGFCAFSVTTVYSSASWLVQFLLMFSDGCALPFLMWLWLRHCEVPGKGFPRDFCLCTGAALLLGIIDICVVTPFMAILL